MEKQPRKRNTDRKANRTVLWRTIALLAVFGVAVFIPLLLQLWDIQIVNKDYYEQLAIKQQTKELTVDANRGTIYDASGKVLAISGTVHNVILSPRDVVELQEAYAKAVEKAQKGDQAYPDYPEPTNEVIAARLSAILGVEEQMVLERLAKTNRQYEMIKAKVEEEVAEQVREFIEEYHLAGGVRLDPTTKRYYPSSSLASHIIGFVNAENVGAYGLEAMYDDELSGEAGRVVTAKNARGTEMLSRYETFVNSVDGYDFELTVDATIQGMLESALQEGIEAYGIRYGGFAIAMDPNTGAILGMASSPEYDLNNYSVVADPDKAALLEELKETATDEEYAAALGQAQLDQWRNKALNDTYEPGSTFKTMVVAAALEEGVVSLNDHFQCTGQVVVAGETIRCSNRTGHGDQTLAQAVANSCNPAFIAIAQKMGAEKFYDYLERFNMIGMTGIDIPGEAASQVWSREFFTGPIGTASLATASFGQRLNVTPIQLICGVAATINGGHVLEPYVVERISDDDNNTVYQHEYTEIRQAVSESTSEIVREMLEGVIMEGGSGKNAYTAGYRIGGKTGTSQTLEDDRFICSFVGFAPANDPKVIVLVAFDGPEVAVPGSNYSASGVYISGGAMAAPAAGKLIANILDYMGVEKQYTPEELSGADTEVPKLVGHYADYAQVLVKKAGLTCRTVGEGDVVTGQIPAAGAYIPGSSQVVLYLGEEVPKDQVEVPDLRGQSPEDAKETLNQLGLFLRATGASDYYESGNKAGTQSVAAGTMVDRGTVIEVRFSDVNMFEYVHTD